MKPAAQITKPLKGWRILVPRGGPWGDSVAADLRARGATPVVAPMINFAPTEDPDNLTRALAALANGEFDWLTVTSATTVDVMYSQGVKIPERTRVAAVGETTAAALQAVGYRVDLVPAKDNSARGMVTELMQLEPKPKRFLTLRSEIAKPLLSEGLAAAGHDVQSVVAYRTIGEPVAENVIADVRSGRINAILVTSGSVAEQVVRQFGDLPESTLVAAIGPRTAKDATSYGLTVDIVSGHQTVSALLDSIVATVEAAQPQDTDY
ncbi:uroporphyrinogen-III synthase [Mycetocola zhujimingii]|uniref:Uroporphyrinogen-III synthase n=1 Tax=Mycetocola zhujimingii TaxID=2079792 RepID=A0A2U1TD86_9MICO|nr:uroporphyrinogen-III synthase [Mycetocola zhujimingii]AWB85281.1 uroporphyrinogen III synthase [Mycetocola zhujimingii]PWC06834.1 uroporphyrinogen-III synthase [Mycetocola zhujimingii]